MHGGRSHYDGDRRRHTSSNDERKLQQKPLLPAAATSLQRSTMSVQQYPIANGCKTAASERFLLTPDQTLPVCSTSLKIPADPVLGSKPPRATPESLSTEDCSSGRQLTGDGNQAGGCSRGSSSHQRSPQTGIRTRNEPQSCAAAPHSIDSPNDEYFDDWTPPYDADSDNDDGDDYDDPDDEDLHPVWSDLIRVNVSGQRFDFRRSVLERHPETLLGNPEKRKLYYDARRGEYFFDRHRPSFEAIFAYFQYGGRLRRPAHVTEDIFLGEVLFHEIEHDVVMTYKRSEGYSEEELVLPDHRKLKEIWKLFEYPETSRAAFIIALVSVTATLVAIVLLCVETLPRFVRSDCQPDGVSPNWFGPFFVVESICHAWFTFELIVRLIACPSLTSLVRDFKTWVDVTALVPYYATLFNMLSTGRCSAAEDVRSSTSLAFLRVIRLVRIFKLTKHSLGLQVLILTFKASMEGLSMFLVALTVSMLVYSSALYYAEVSVPGSKIESIPDAFWWAIITMTTVGYGDMVPVGWMGRIIGAACAISGILTLAIPVPIIAGHFNRFYSHKTGRARLQMANNL